MHHLVLPRQFERQDDILNYDIAQSQRPTFGQQAGLMAGAVNAYRGADGNNWLFNTLGGIFNPSQQNP